MSETLVLRQSRKKTALAILASVVFVAIGVWMITDPSRGSERYSPEMVLLMGWVCVLFFGAAGMVSIYGLMRPMRVVLSPEGFQVFGMRRPPLVRWRDVEQFFVCEIKRSRFVCYVLKPETKSTFQRVMGRPSGWGDGQVPAYLELSPNEVHRLFDEWRGRYTG